MVPSNDKLDTFVDQVTEIKKIYFDELNHLVENSRWLTTVVLAEIGGIAAYRNLIEAKSLSIPFALSIVLLALTIVCFMICVLLSRNAKKNISTLIKEDVAKVRSINEDESISSNDAKGKIAAINIQLDNAISSTPNFARILEGVGIVLFVMGSIFTAVVLFSSEILKLFGL